MRLKHFPTGLLRCGISKRKAKLFVTALMVAATAQTCFAQNAIEGVQDLVGKTITDLENGITNPKVYPHENQTKIWLYRYCPWMRGMATSQISCNNGIDKKASHVPL